MKTFSEIKSLSEKTRILNELFELQFPDLQVSLNDEYGSYKRLDDLDFDDFGASKLSYEDWYEQNHEDLKEDYFGDYTQFIDDLGTDDLEELEIEYPDYFYQEEGTTTHQNGTFFQVGGVKFYLVVVNTSSIPYVFPYVNHLPREIFNTFSDLPDFDKRKISNKTGRLPLNNEPVNTNKIHPNQIVFKPKYTVSTGFCTYDDESEYEDNKSVMIKALSTVLSIVPDILGFEPVMINMGNKTNKRITDMITKDRRLIEFMKKKDIFLLPASTEVGGEYNTFILLKGAYITYELKMIQKRKEAQNRRRPKTVNSREDRNIEYELKRRARDHEHDARLRRDPLPPQQTDLDV